MSGVASRLRAGAYTPDPRRRWLAPTEMHGKSGGPRAVLRACLLHRAGRREAGAREVLAAVLARTACSRSACAMRVDDGPGVSRTAT